MFIPRWVRHGMLGMLESVVLSRAKLSLSHTTHTLSARLPNTHPPFIFPKHELLVHSAVTPERAMVPLHYVKLY